MPRLLEFAVLVAGGALAGIAANVAGVASLVAFPLMISFGLTPIAANVTVTCANGFVTVGALVGARRELAGLGRLVLRISVVTALGGCAGAALLLVAPADSFAVVAPWLVAGASVVVMVQPWLARRAALRRPEAVTGPAPTPRRVLALAGVTVYTGYFGAAAGVLALGVLASMLPLPLARVNAVKTVTQGVANLVAASGFVLFGPVQWRYVVPLAIGFMIGGVIGPAVVRRLPGESLRYVVGAGGFAIALYLALR